MRKNIFAISAAMMLMSQTAMASSFCPCFGGKETPDVKETSVSGVETPNPILQEEAMNRGDQKYGSEIDSALVAPLVVERG